MTPANWPFRLYFMVHVRPLKGQCRSSKDFPPLHLVIKVDQNIFFPETCFAYNICEPEFTVSRQQGLPNLSLSQMTLLELSFCSNSDFYKVYLC